MLDSSGKVVKYYGYTTGKAFNSYVEDSYEYIIDNGITVEYTDQKKIYRKALNYNANRPEFTSYFFNDDENPFRLFLRYIARDKVKIELKNDSIKIIKYISK